MVEITVVFEGGVIGDSAPKTALENTQFLRQSLNRLFEKVLNHRVRITVQPQGGYRAAAAIFAQQSDADNTCLYVDLDAPSKDIEKWFLKIEKENPKKPIIIPKNRKSRVFFMIQEMEAWFLKQPEAIEKWGEDNGYDRIGIASVGEHDLISGKNIEEISKPSSVLDTIVQQTFRHCKNGQQKKVKYKKLKSSHQIIDCIDCSKLLTGDTEFKRFVEAHESK